MEALDRLFYSGTSGISLPTTKVQFPKEFKGLTRLQYYSMIFNSIEINSIFYKLPKSSTLIKWAESVPDDFRFTLKIPKSITHSHHLQFSVEEINDFMALIELIGPKTGCLLAQFPPSIAVERINQLKNLLETFQQHASFSFWNLAIEFRNTSWYVSQVNHLLKNYNVQLVFHDMMRAPTLLPWPIPEGNFVYIRFHGPEKGYRGNYSNAFLKSVAIQIKEYLRQKKTVYVYFNNTMGGAYENLQTLNNYVGS